MSINDGWVTSPDRMVRVRVLVGDTKTPAPVGQHPSKPMVLGIEAGSDFTVSVESLRPAKGGPVDGLVALEIDGQNVGYQVGIRPTPGAASFVGWYEDTTFTSYRRFRTCSLAAQSGSSCSGSRDSGSVGTLKVVIRSATGAVSYRSGASATAISASPSNAKGSPSANKKFFQEASLKTSQGVRVSVPARTHSVRSTPTGVWSDSFTLEYDQLAHLRLRGYAFRGDEKLLEESQSAAAESSSAARARNTPVKEEEAREASSSSSGNRKRKASAFVDCIELVDHYDLTLGDEPVHSIEKRQRTLEQVLDLLE